MTIIKSDLKFIDIFSSINVALIGVMKHLKKEKRSEIASYLGSGGIF